jgi:hypothetical protein
VKITKRQLTALIREMAETFEDDANMEIVASDGEQIEVGKRYAGMATGFGLVANPAHYPEDHPLWAPGWKVTDWDTVIEVEEGMPGAMPVADAYQALFRQWAEKDRDRELSSLKQYWKEQEETDRRLDAERAELEAARVPDPGQKAPKRQGMGRRPTAVKAQRQWESKMKVKRSQLERIIQEELDNWVRPDPEKTARAINRTSIEPEDAVGWIEDLVPHLEDADDEGRIMGHGGTAKMAKSQLFTVARIAQSLQDRLQDEDEIPEWVQSKVAAMVDDVHEIADHLDYKMRDIDDAEVGEIEVDFTPYV